MEASLHIGWHHIEAEAARGQFFFQAEIVSNPKIILAGEIQQDEEEQFINFRWVINHS